MTSHPGLHLSFDEIMNLRTFEDVCQHANWPQDTIPPQAYSRIAPDNRPRWIQHWCGTLITTECWSYPRLEEELCKLEGKKEYININNLKVYLALKVSCTEWVNGYIFEDTVGNILIPEIQSVLHQVEEYIKQQPSPYDAERIFIEKAFTIGEKAHPDFRYASADLCQILEQYHRQFLLKMEHYLSPYTSIVAPSGTGKSYTVSQLAVKHNKYVIYLNFAPEYHKGYPGRSSYASLILEALNKVIQGLPFLERRHKMEWIWSIVIWALLRLARSARASGVSAHDFFRLQIDGGDVRKQDVITSALQFAINQPPFRCPTNQLPNPTADWQAFDDHCKNAFTTPGPQEMTNDDANRSIQPHNLAFVVCIDEARNLLGGPEGDSTLFRSLRQALWWTAKYGDESSFFGVFLDTTSKVSNFSPAHTRDPSQKVRTGERPSAVLFPPYHQFFTKNIYAPPTPPQFDIPQVSWDVLLNFGRPLWGALLQGGSTCQAVVDLCKEKCQPSEPPCQDLHTKTGLLALVSYRIPFTISNFALAESLVSQWMHTLIDVSDDREQLMVLQPGEPILALAAFQYGMTMSDMLLKALEVLDQELYWNSVNVGDIGEFIAGLILLLAFDTASFVSFPEPLPLQVFLKNLLGDAVVKDLLTVSKDSLDLNFGTMLSFGTVFFNRIYRRVTAPSETDIYNMYRTCTACYLPPGFNGVDILIPVWVPPQDDRMGYVGCILVQVKNKAYHRFAANAMNSAYDHTNRGFTALKFSRKMPSIGFMMSLRGIKHGSRVRHSSVSDKKNLGIILSVGLDAERYPMFQGPPEDPYTLVKQQVLRYFQTILSAVNTIELQKNKDAYKRILFETEYLP
ncbi:hypothetical protein HOO65_010002 [Ceratocystis lukuohia]|uniref:Uncharacterized protein n=1 Tax=Ceratocystis lukuohia TaxID=2019550 RepID=A0ABR4MR34_9PEZI